MKYLLPLLLFISGCVAARPPVSPYLVGDAYSPPAPPPAKREAVPSPRFEKKETSTIFLDAGHGGEDKGTSTKSKRLLEKHLTLETAKRVERLLTAKGYRVFMTRRKDVFVPLLDRVKMASKRQANIFVSIHYNFTKNTVINGAEIFYFNDQKQLSRTKQSRVLASSILKKLTDNVSSASRGVKAGNFCVIRETSMPAVLVEAAFLSNPNEARLLLDVTYRNKIAQAIADGIDGYFTLGSAKQNPASLSRR